MGDIMYKIEVKIDDMACAMCEAHINEVISNNFKIKKVKSSHRDGLTTIIANDMVDQDKIRKYIDDTGYKVKDISVSPYEKKSIFGW